MSNVAAMISSGVVCRELIGRASELAHLLARVPRAADRPSAAIVVRGEAGVGKTRLMREFAAAAAAQGIRVASCAAREYSNAPYAPLVEALESLGARAALAEPEGAGGDAADDKTRRFNTAAEQLTAIAEANGGLAIIVEDVQWADGGTVDLLRFLAQRLSDVPILFVVTYRIDEVEPDSARLRMLAALERDAGESIAVEPLRDEAIERMLRSILRDAETTVSPALLAEIRDLADGRPLFAEELLRGVLERISRDGDARAIVPTSFRSTVRERFAVLGPDDRDVLLHASVVGRRFSASFLSTLLAVEPANVFRALRRARDQQLVVEEGDDDGDAFAFRHALTRETIYAELLRAEARALHARVAVALSHERRLDVAAIAEHTYRARDAEHALAWNERAGDAASALYANLDAARFYERAHEFARDSAQRAGLAEKVADAWYATGALESAAAWISRAIEELDERDERRAKLTIRHAIVLWEGGRRESSIETVRRITTGPAGGPLRFQAEITLATLLTGSRRPVEALEHLAIAEPLLPIADPKHVMRFHGIKGHTLALLGRADEAREPFARAVAGARESGDNDVLLRALNNQGNGELVSGTIASARALYDEALAIAERTKNLRIVAWVSQNAAVAALVGGDLAAAQQHLDRSTSIEHEVPAVHGWSDALTLRLRTLLGCERDEARRAAFAALQASRRVGEDHELTDVLGGALAYDALADGRIVDAQAIVAGTLGAIVRPQAPYWLLTVAARTGDVPERARALELVRAIAADGTTGARAVLALMEAREALRRRRRDEAAALAETAAALFEEVGWAVEQGEALELAGRVADAVALFRRIGAQSEVRRLTETGVAAPRKRGEATLTAREREIVSLVLAGRTARAIADALVISERTVETHIASVYRKFGVTSRQELAIVLAAPASAAPT